MSNTDNYINILETNPTELISKVLSKSSDSNEGVAGDLSRFVKEILDPMIALQKSKNEKSSTILDQIYIDGLDSHQVWEQAKLVIDNNVDQLMFNDIPEIKSLSGAASASDMSDNEQYSDSEESVSEDGEQEEDEQRIVDVSDDEYEDYKRPSEQKIEEGSEEESLSEKEEEGEQVSEEEEEEDDDEQVVEEEDDDEEQEQEKNQNSNGYGLNDDFFSLNEFNKQVLAAEEKGDMLDEDEEEIDYFGDLSDGSDEELEYYDDFFDKPQDEKTKSIRKFRKEDVEDEEEEFNDDEYDNAMTNTMNDLFADDDLSEKKAKAQEENLSTFEKQQRQIQKQIAELEREAVEEKKWTMKGEASAKNRPTDALLDEELEFDRNAKPVPVITKEVTESIEDLIRRRIKNYEFDDLPRRLFSEVNNAKFQFGQNDFNLEEVGKKSQKSLAEIYEDEHYKGITDETVKSEELKQRHDQIIQAYQMLSYKLDSLCSAHYIPKPATKSLDIKVNTSTIQMEDAQPLALASESTLAPQEVYKIQSGVDKNSNEVQLANGLSVSKDELTKEERKNLRLKNKRRQKRANKELHSKKAKKSKKDTKSDVLETLKKGNVQVIDKKGGRKDMDGNVIRDSGKSKSVSFKL